MYRHERSLRNTIIATVVLILIAIIGVITIFRYSYKAIPTVVIATGTSTQAIIATSTPPPSQNILSGILPHPAPVANQPVAYGQTSFSAGQTISYPDFSVTLTKVEEDSRCPTDVNCIQAGTVKLLLAVQDYVGTHHVLATLGQATSTASAKLTLISVIPENSSKRPVSENQYRYTIDVEKAAPVAQAKCIIGGCSNEVCSDTQHVSSCIYRASYACYKTATCERQPSGECGWTPSPTLAACIAAANNESSGDSPQ